jgi:hypothetical protein
VGILLLAPAISYADILPEKEICAAALESLLHRGSFPKYIKSNKEPLITGEFQQKPLPIGTIHIFASRKKPSDLDACYIGASENQVNWRVEKADGINKGRWRNHFMDEKVLFKITEDKVTITLNFYDGSKTKTEYSLAKLTKGIK